MLNFLKKSWLLFILILYFFLPLAFFAWIYGGWVGLSVSVGVLVGFLFSVSLFGGKIVAQKLGEDSSLSETVSARLQKSVVVFQSPRPQAFIFNAAFSNPVHFVSRGFLLNIRESELHHVLDDAESYNRGLSAYLSSVGLVILFLGRVSGNKQAKDSTGSDIRLWSLLFWPIREWLLSLTDNCWTEPPPTAGI